MTAGVAVAGDKFSADQILNALQPKKPLTRGLSTGAPGVEVAVGRQADPLCRYAAATARPGRSRSASVRKSPRSRQSKPKIDLEIQFDYNSADISKTSMPAAQELGKALSKNRA